VKTRTRIALVLGILVIGVLVASAPNGRRAKAAPVDFGGVGNVPLEAEDPEVATLESVRSTYSPELQPSPAKSKWEFVGIAGLESDYVHPPRVWRLSVPGGWLVSSYCRYGYRACALVFVSDPEHEWRVSR